MADTCNIPSSYVLTIPSYTVGYPYVHDMGVIEVKPQLQIGYQLYWTCNDAGLKLLHELPLLLVICGCVVVLWSAVLMFRKRRASTRARTRDEDPPCTPPRAKREFESTEQYFAAVPYRLPSRVSHSGPSARYTLSPDGGSLGPVTHKPRRAESFTDRLFGLDEDAVVVRKGSAAEKKGAKRDASTQKGLW